MAHKEPYLIKIKAFIPGLPCEKPSGSVGTEFYSSFPGEIIERVLDPVVSHRVPVLIHQELVSVAACLPDPHVFLPGVPDHRISVNIPCLLPLSKDGYDIVPEARGLQIAELHQPEAAAE
ncbi:MAG: hypothetical protein M1476_01200 [Candidatus Thermoplasmatota archaeon]|nr:hypothetical protein [Candidatus Thermoplasmatota archaeon]